MDSVYRMLGAVAGSSVHWDGVGRLIWWLPCPCLPTAAQWCLSGCFVVTSWLWHYCVLNNGFQPTMNNRLGFCPPHCCCSFVEGRCEYKRNLFLLHNSFIMFLFKWHICFQRVGVELYKHTCGYSECAGSHTLWAQGPDKAALFPT